VLGAEHEVGGAEADRAGLRVDALT